jgi:hypothetical protein
MNPSEDQSGVAAPVDRLVRSGSVAEMSINNRYLEIAERHLESQERSVQIMENWNLCEKQSLVAEPFQRLVARSFPPDEVQVRQSLVEFRP